MPESEAGTLRSLQLKQVDRAFSIVSLKPFYSKPEMSRKNLKISSSTYFSPQLWQISHLQKLHTTILVSNGLHLVSPETYIVRRIIVYSKSPLQKRRGYALCQAGDDGHQLLLVIAAVEHQGFSPDAVLLLL